MFDVFLLSVLQGVAEFLPISSSGHLAIGHKLLAIDEPALRLEVCLHFGTLLSVFAYYRKTIARLLGGCFLPSASREARRESWAYAFKICASAVPAVAVYFCFRSEIDSFFSNVKMVGALLMFTGAVLVGTRYLPRGTGGVTFFRAVAMGVGQAVALLPGVSRSGMTIACARAGKVDPEKSAEFSFLMSAPLIVGGLVLEIAKCFGAEGSAGGGEGWGDLCAGMAVSAVVGYLSLSLLVKSLKGRWFWLFGPYCIAVGLLVAVFAS